MSASQEKKKRKKLSALESDPKKIAAEKRKKMKAKIGALCLEIGAIVVAVVFLALLIYNSGVLHRSMNAVSMGDHTAKVTELNYYYNSAYKNAVSNMGEYASYYGLDATKDIHKQKSFFDETKTWADYFYDTALETMQREIVQADLALQEGMTLTEEDTASIDSSVVALEQTAAANAMTVTEYLRTLFGKGITLGNYRTLLERQVLSTKYMNKYLDSLTYSESDLEDYYKEDPSIFDTYTYRSFFVSGFNPDSEDDSEVQKAAASAKADEMISRLQAVGDPAQREELYAQLCSEYCAPDYVATYKNDPDFTLKRFTTKDSLDEYLSEYVTDESRSYGDVAVFDGETGYYVVMFVDYGRNEYRQVTYHQIYISPNKDKTSNWTDEEWAAAKETAQTLFDLTQADGFTLDKFAEYAGTYSNDAATSSNGGLYSSVVPGAMDTKVYDWLYEAEQEHTQGEVGLVQGTNGYYLIHFDSYDGVSWENTATGALKQRDYTDWLKGASSGYEISKNSLGLFLSDY